MQSTKFDAKILTPFHWITRHINSELIIIVASVVSLFSIIFSLIIIASYKNNVVMTK